MPSVRRVSSSGSSVAGVPLPYTQPFIKSSAKTLAGCPLKRPISATHFSVS
jgi:hypothetical protein